MKAVGIDLGTTSVCGVVVDTVSGKVLKSRTENSGAFIKSEKSFEKIQSAERIVDKAKNILESLVDDEVVAIGVTGQMHGIVYLDKEGNAVSPLYIWQDERGNERFGDTTYAKYLNSFSGYGNVTDFYNRQNGLVPSEAVGYCTIHDYFVMKICGLKEPKIHCSNAASFGLYDFVQNTFDYPFHFKIIKDYCIAGYYKNVPVSVAIGDNQASVFSTLKNQEDLLINVGTGSQVSVVSETAIKGENIEVRPYFEDKFLIVGCALCGGRAYSCLKNFYKEILSFAGDFTDDEVYSFMGEMLFQTEKTSLVADTRFAGTRKDPTLRGSVSGISDDNFSPKELTCAVLSGMCEELYSMYGETGIKAKGIVASGNGIRKNAAFVEILSNKFGGQVKIPVHVEEAAFGAALFALISAGVFENAGQAQRLISYD